jgi:hypothetical protein
MREGAKLTWVKSEGTRKILVVLPSVEILTHNLVSDPAIESVEFATY